MKKTGQFISWFVLLLAVAGLFRSFFVHDVLPGEDSFRQGLLLHQLYTLFYGLIPLFAVLLVERKQWKTLWRAYGLGLKNLQGSAAAWYLVLTFVLFPLFLLLGYALLCLGTSSEGCGIPWSLSWKAVVWAIVWGLTVGAIGALPGEIAWRGFLEKQITLRAPLKYLVIGCLWGLWCMPVLLFAQWGDASLSAVLLAGGCVLGMCVACSYFYAAALHHTGSLWVPVLLQGVISSSFCYYLLPYLTPCGDALWTGRQGILSCVAVLLVWGVTACLMRRKSSRKSCER